MSSDDTRRNAPLVRCGWCPMLLPHDPEVWREHHFIEHGAHGYSIRHDVSGTDWNIEELTDADA